MTDQDFRDALVARINLNLDLPFVDEGQEEVAIRWVVDKVSHLIPQSLRDFILDAADGITAAEAKRLEDVLVAFLNSVIDVPWMPESIEEKLIRPVVQAVLDYTKIGKSLQAA